MNLYELKKKIDSLMAESLQRAVEKNLDLPEIQTESCDDFRTEEERDVVELICQTAKHLGGDETEYSEGLFSAVFSSKQSVADFTAFLEANENVESYEIEAITSKEIGEDEVDFEHIEDDEETLFEVFVYLVPEIVTYIPEEIDEDEYDPNDEDDGRKIYEVRRVVKINFRGKRRIKMQCRPGFKWDRSKRTCVKIGGSELAKKRIALRKAVRTKKAMGSSFRVRVLRKRRKAMRFRKSMGFAN